MRGRALRPGDVVRVIAPAGPINEENFRRGIDRLRSWGLSVEHRADVFTQVGFHAGDDRRRTLELNEALADPDCRAVFCARGGYGTLRILETVSEESVWRSPRPLVGFSDVTALLVDLWRRTGLRGLHAPMPATRQFLDMTPEAEEWYRRLIFSSEPPGRAPGFACDSLSGGNGEGILLPANLTMLVHLMAAGRAPDFAGAVVVLEDTGEAAYRIDRMLFTLRLAGVFEKIAGLVFGSMTGIETSTFVSIVRSTLTLGRFPVLYGAPVGHDGCNLALPVGSRARIDGLGGTLEILESPVC